MLRLSKLMSQRGLCSRREADSLIERGHVFVNGEKVTTLGIKVQEDVEIQISEKSGLEKQVTLAYHKPLGVVSGQSEGDYKNASEMITKENKDPQFKGGALKSQHFAGLAPAGRLDINSTGLLILTQSGVIAKNIVGENSPLEKEYLVRFQGEITDKKLKLLRHGLSLDGEPLRPAQVEQINPDQLQFILTQGKKRQIRRMCEQVDIEVTALKRVHIGNLKLGTLKLGHWRFIEKGELS